ncbi:MAG TPA: sugar transferase [Candidatus Limnocylindrales bacterium]
MPDIMQRAVGLAGALLSLPVLAVLALAIRVDSAGPVIFSSTRIGADGQPFRLHKLRTMTWGAEHSGSAVTVAADPRMTRVGRMLRRLRIDELPQLWNVARGDMRLVGPRPEDPRFVDLSNGLHREVFAAPPGMTGLTQLMYAHEAALIDPLDPERHYREVVLPAKLRLDAVYLRHRSLRLDLWILAQTPRAVLGRPISPPRALSAELPAEVLDA